jgi:cell division protein FtsW
MAALASGSWWGEGLGQSRQKYNYLPEAHNDFIFAILGEELGFIGALVVIGLFAILALSLARIILRSSDRFVRVAAGCVLAWFVGQAFVNVGMVTGLLPVIGIPLPFISYGGTSLVVSLFTAGFAMSLARTPTHPAIELSALEDPESRVD